MSEKTVCIIGVAGFIGSHLLESIVAENKPWKVIGVDMAEPDRIKHLLSSPNLEFHKMNIVHKGEKIKELISQSDVVINLAAICNPSEYLKQPVNTIKSNYSDAVPVIEYCVEYDVHLIHFSTCEVYGRTLVSYGLSKDDPKNYVLDEESTPMIMGPISAQRWCYATAKQLVERLIYAYGTERKLKFTIVRPYNWIGARMDYVPGVDGDSDGLPRVMASFMTALMKNESLVLVNGGQNYRTFCYVKDAVDATIRMVEEPESSCGHSFNVGNPDNNIQIKDLAALMISIYNRLVGGELRTTRYVDGEEYYGKGYEDSDLRIPSMDLVGKQLKWKATMPLNEALETTMKGFIDQYLHHFEFAQINLNSRL